MGKKSDKLLISKYGDIIRENLNTRALNRKNNFVGNLFDKLY